MSHEAVFVFLSAFRTPMAERKRSKRKKGRIGIPGSVAKPVVKTRSPTLRDIGRSKRFRFAAMFALSCIGLFALVHFLPPFFTAPINAHTGSTLGLVLIWFVDQFMILGFSLFDWRLIIPRDTAIYYETFNIVTFTSLVLATRSIEWPRRIVRLAVGLAVLFLLHLVHRIDNLLITGFSLISAVRFDYVVCAIGQYVLPFLLWLMMKVATSRAKLPTYNAGIPMRSPVAFSRRVAG